MIKIKTTAYYVLVDETVAQLDLRREIKGLPVTIQQRILKYKQQKDLNLSALAYVLLNWMIVTDWGGSTALTLREGNYGKPMLEQSALKFNLSHCDHGVAVCVAATDVGIDIQNITEVDCGVVALVCHEEEKNQLKTRPESARLFTKYWCLKESYVKQLGYGLGFLALTSLDFSKYITPGFTFREKHFLVKEINNCYISVCSGNEDIELKEIKLRELLGNIGREN